MLFKKIRHKLANLIGVISCIAMVIQPVVVSAQINVESGQTATVDGSFNNLPDVLNIAEPNARGLSHNKFTDFNVKQEGLVINNSNQATTSQLAGSIIANPNLNGNDGATIILNEVTSGNASQILGFQELVGRQAEYILANPNGITCNGCGFINFPRATMTTGTPNITGGNLIGFTVNNGQITINGTGINAGTDILDLVARNIFLDGQVNAKNLGITAGNNIFNYASRTATSQGSGGASTIAIDASVLGGIYANTINLISTEAGSGVRMLGDVAATVDNLTIDSSGNIIFGTNDVSAQNNITLDTVSGVRFSGVEMFAGNSLNVTGDNHSMTGGASIGANRDVIISGATLSTSGAANKLYAKRNMDITLTGQISVENLQLEADNNLDITGRDIEFYNNTTVIGNASAYRSGTKGTGRLTVTENGTLLNVDASSSLSSGNAITINTNGSGFTNSGVLDSLGVMNIMAGTLTNSGDIVSGSDIIINSDEITNSQKIASNRDLTIGSNGYLFNESNGTLSAARNLQINSLSTTPTFLAVLNDGLIFSGDTMSIIYGGTSEFYNNAGTIFSRNNMLLGAATPTGITGEKFSNISGTIMSLNGDITINADTVNNSQPSVFQSAKIMAGNDININFKTTLNNEASLISAGNDINIDGDPDGDTTNGDLTNDDPNAIEGAVIEAVNNIDIINVAEVNNGTIGADAGAGNTIDQSDPSTLSGLTLPTDPNGLFVATKNANANFLIESNPDFNLDALYGSDYLLTRLGHDPDEFRRLGDNYYELTLLREQIIGMFGLRFVLEGAKSEDEQFRMLMDNALSVQEDLNLALGVALTKEQIAGLGKDIVWMVTKVVDGQEVLVPKLYLASATIARLSTGGQSQITAGNDLNIIASDTIRNQAGVMRAENNLSLTAQNDIINYGGTIRGENRVNLTAIDGNIVNESIKKTDIKVVGPTQNQLNWFGSFFNDDEDLTTTTTATDFISNQASISSGGNVTMTAGNDIKIKGADVQADNNFIMDAGQNVQISNIDLNTTTTVEKRTFNWFGIGTKTTKKNTNTKSSSNVTAGNDIVIKSGESITNERSNIEAGNSLSLIAENNISNINGQLKAGTNANDDTTGRMLLYAKEGSIQNYTTGRHDTASIEALGDTYLIAKGDIQNRGATIASGGDIAMQSREGSILNTTNKFRIGDSRNYTEVLGNTGTIISGGDTTMIAKKDIKIEASEVSADGKLTIVAQEGGVDITTKRLDSKKTWTTTKTVESGWWIFKKKKKKTTTHTSNSERFVGSNVSGGEGTIIAANGGNINIKTSNVGSEESDTILIASNDIDVTGSMDKLKSTTETTENTTIIGVETDGKKETINTTDETWNGSNIVGNNIHLQSGGNTSITGSDLLANDNISINADGTINIKAVKETDTLDSESSSHEFYAESDTKGASAFAQTGHRWNSEETHIKDETVIGSNLNAGGNVTLNAGKNINIESSDVSAGANLGLDAGQDINVTALAENDSYSYSEEQHESGFQANADLNKTDAGTYYKGSEASLDMKSKVHKTSSLTSGGNMSLKAGRDIKEQGTEVTAGGNINVDASRDFVSKAVTDTLSIIETGAGRRADLGVGIKLGAENMVESIASLFGGGDAVDSGQSNDNTAVMNDPTLNAGMNAEYVQSQYTNSFEQGKSRSSKWTSGNDLTINAGRDVRMTGTQIEAGNNLTVDAGRNMKLTAANDYIITSNSHEVFGGEAVGDPFTGSNATATGGYRGTTETEESTTAKAVTLKSGGNMSLKSGNNMTLEGTQAEAGKSMDLKAGNNLNITAARDTYSRTKDTLNVQAGASYSAATGGGGKTHITYEEDSEKSTTAKVANFRSGGNLSMDAENNLTLEGSNIDAGGNVDLKAGNDFAFNAAEDTYSRERTFVDVNIDLKKAKGKNKKPVRNGYNATRLQSLKSRAKFLGAKAGNAGKKGGRANNKYNQNVGVQVETESTDMKIRNGGSIKSGGDLKVTAGRDVSMEGTKATKVGGNITVDAIRDINLKSAKSIIKSDKTAVSIGVGIQNTGLNVDDEHYDATLYDGTALVTDKNITLRSGRDTNLSGSVVSGENVTANVGRNLNIEAKINKEKFRGGGMALQAGLSSGASARPPEGYGGIVEDIAISGIRAENSLKVDVNGNTNLEGGYLTSETGNLDVNTGTLTVADVQANSEYGSVTTWGQTSSEKAQATIGQGNLTVRNGKTPKGLNRDKNNHLVYGGDKLSTLVGDPNEGAGRISSIRDKMQKKRDDVEKNRDKMQINADKKIEKTNKKIDKHTAPLFNKAMKTNVLGVVKQFGNTPNRVPLTVQKSLLKRAGVLLTENANRKEINNKFLQLFKNSQ